MTYLVNEFNSLEEFKSIKDEWNKLLSESECDQPFLRHEWLTIWWNNFGGKGLLAIITVKNSGKLVFAIPLMEVRNPWSGFVTLKSMTNHHSHKFHFLSLNYTNDAIGAFFDYLKTRKRRWDLLHLQEISTQVKSYEEFLRQAKNHGIKSGTWNRGGSAYISITGSWDEYFNSLKSKFRSNLRNRNKRLLREGEVTYVLVEEGREINSALEKGFEIEKTSWKGANKTAIACDPALVRFYSEIAQVAAKNRWLRLSFLKVDNQYVAFDYSLKYNNKLYCLKIGYDPKFKPYSVGQLLCKANIKKSFDDNLVEYDFLGEMTTQKSDWTGDCHSIIWISCYNRTVLGILHFIYKYLIKQKIKEKISR